MGGTCYLPQDITNYVSVAMNLYYQSKGSNKWDCDFRGTGIITLIDPSKLLGIIPNI